MEEQNVGTLDQVVRMGFGSLASLSGIILLLPGKASVVSGAVGIMLVFVSLYLFATGSTGYCQIYRRLGWDTRNVRAKNSGVPLTRRLSHHAVGHRRRNLLMLLLCLSMTFAIAWIMLEVWGS